MISNEFLGRASGEIRNTLMSIVPMIIYDFAIRPLISDYISSLQLPNIPFPIINSDSLLIGVIAFLYIHLRRASPSNLDLILQQADMKIIERNIKIRDRAEDERGKTRHGSEQWNELTEKIAFYDRHIGHYERRIKTRRSSQEDSS